MPLDKVLIKHVQDKILVPLSFVRLTLDGISTQTEQIRQQHTLNAQQELIKKGIMEILTNPGNLTGLPDYQLKPEDREFLEQLAGDTEKTIFTNLIDVEQLSLRVLDYCIQPYTG